MIVSFTSGTPRLLIGAASTMAGMAEALGMALSGHAAVPEGDARARAVALENIDDYKAGIADDSLDIDEACVLVLKTCGSRGYPGMAEVGNMGQPPTVLKKGIIDMVRISDARMPGTACGTVVLRTAPEAARGGPHAILGDGDMIELEVASRRLHPDLSDEQIARRLAKWTNPDTAPAGRYERMFHDHVEGADTGADFDFLRGCRGAAVPKDSH